MASPVVVKLTCPLCGSVFRARTIGSNYYISGVGSDLRETGSIDEVRRYSIASCQVCCYSDYSWDFLAPDDLGAEARRRLEEVLEVDSAAPGRALNRRVPDFERFHLAAECFQARGLDRSAMAELGLLAYYVARDLGRRDLEPELRKRAAELFVKALEDEDLPGPLRLRYAYLAGELYRRGGKRKKAKALFDSALDAAGQESSEDDARGAAWDIARMARRQRAAVVYWDAKAKKLLELTRGLDDDVAAEARRLLSLQRDKESVQATKTAWKEATAQQRTEMLRELVNDPAPDHKQLFLQALESLAPEDIRLAAHALGTLQDADTAEALLVTLERGVLSTEAALIEGLRRLEAPGKLEAVAKILEAWEARDKDAGDDDWYFSSDTTPLRHMLYTSGERRGLDLLIRDMQSLEENDLWDKIPSGGPVSAALASHGQVTQALKDLLSDSNPAARRWAAYCLAELGEGRAEVEGLVSDPEQVVRLQGVTALAWLGDTSHEAVALRELRSLDSADLPFALHFLVPFKSDAVKEFLLDLLDSDKTTTGEILPLLGRQEPDDRVGEILSMSLLDTNDDTRAGAVTGLAYQGGVQAAMRLRLLYDQEDSEEVLRRVVFGLGNLAKAGVHTEETIVFLRERLNKANPRLRFAVAMTLLKLGDPSGVDLVRERAALFEQSIDRYDLVAPALKALAEYEAQAV